jgi:hypothetical protein
MSGSDAAPPKPPSLADEIDAIEPPVEEQKKPDKETDE